MIKKIVIAVYGAVMFVALSACGNDAPETPKTYPVGEHELIEWKIGDIAPTICELQKDNPTFDIPVEGDKFEFYSPDDCLFEIYTPGTWTTSGVFSKTFDNEWLHVEIDGTKISVEVAPNTTGASRSESLALSLVKQHNFIYVNQAAE